MKVFTTVVVLLVLIKVQKFVNFLMNVQTLKIQGPS